MMILMLVSGLAVTAVRVLAALVRPPLRLATGLLSLIPVPGRPLRSPSELEDGREYEFRCRGARTRRTYFSDPARAKADEREAFTLAEDSSTSAQGIQCWQKRYPDGSPVGPGTGCWTTLNLFFGKRARKDPRGIALRRVA